MELEKLGIPTVTFVTRVFGDLANAEASRRGMRDLAMIVLPHPIAAVPEEVIVEHVQAAADRIVTSLEAPR